MPVEYSWSGPPYTLTSTSPFPWEDSRLSKPLDVTCHGS